MLPPKAKGNSLSHLISIAGNHRMDWMEKLYREYGDILYVKIFHADVVVINHPEYAKQVLNNPNVFGKNSAAFYAVRKVLGKGLLTSEGKLWIKQRKIMQPYFHKAQIDRIVEQMIDCIDEKIDALEDVVKNDSSSVNIVEWMNRITLEITVRCLFSVKLTKTEVDRIIYLVQFLLDDVQRVAKFPGVSDKLPTLANRKFKRNLVEFGEIVKSIIEKRAAQKDNTDDLFSMMLATDKAGQPLMPDQQVFDEVTTFILTGYETTAHALSWLWKLLFDNPSTHLQLKKLSLQTLENGRKPTPKDYEKLSPIIAAFNETLRLFPNMPILSRRAKKEFTLGEYLIPKDTEVFINTFILQSREDYWQAPLLFKPERFSENKSTKHHPFAFIPWGGGPRKCIGYHFSLMEAAFIVSMMLSRFDICPLQQEVNKILTVLLKPDKLLVDLKPIDAHQLNV